jgi:hypothetical protein
LWVPAASVAGGPSPSSSKLAKTEATHAKTDASGPARFCKSHRSGGKVRGAGKNVFGKCVSTIAMHKAESEGNDSAESQDKDSAEDLDKDSAESQDKNSGESQDKNSAESQHTNTANPAMTCKAMQANDLAHFQTTYGTRPNAFGTCVAKQANTKTG